jgi:hypothetical protein
MKANANDKGYQWTMATTGSQSMRTQRSLKLEAQGAPAEHPSGL